MNPYENVGADPEKVLFQEINTIANNLGRARKQGDKSQENIYSEELEKKWKYFCDHLENPAYGTSFTADDLLNIDLALKTAGEDEKIIYLYNNIIEKIPESSEMIVALGHIYRDKGEFAKAATLYEDGIRKKIKFLEENYNINLADLRYGIFQYLESKQIPQVLDLADYKRHYSQSLNGCDKNLEALTEIKDAILFYQNAKTERCDAYEVLGDIQLKLNNLEKAKDAYKKALQLFNKLQNQNTEDYFEAEKRPRISGWIDVMEVEKKLKKME